MSRGKLVTKDTITFKQLRALRDRYVGTGDGDKCHHTLIAIGDRRAAKGETRAMSLARCADLHNTLVIATCVGRTHRDHATVTCNGTCCTACGGPIDDNQECRC